MKAEITNIVLENDRFRVFVRFENGVEENNLFMPEVTADDIRAWVADRKQYFLDLQAQELELKEELLGEV